ncbi:MAG TPA: TPM domain-containing protein [Candidatus Eisenbacteria bacterium]|nr:TPM domain-containing protein [Candidatus Eisenbacteria bacterium]
MISGSICSLRITDRLRPKVARGGGSWRGAVRRAALVFPLAALAVLLAASPRGYARDWPAPTGHLSDFAHVVDPASTDSIESLAVELREKTGSELAVATFPDLGGEEIEPAATDLFAKWGVGRKGENDGVLILLTVAERRIRIEPGYGLEGVLPDGRCGGIIRLVMGPYLHANQFGTGLLRGAQAVAAAIAQEKGVTLTGSAGITPPPLEGSGGPPSILGLVLILLFFVIVSSAFNRATRGRRGWSDWSGRGGGWYGPWGGGFGGMGGMGGMGGSRGGFGGFGGFGGGMSGGGGASGRF